VTHTDLPLGRTTLAVDALFTARPPRWLHRNKKALYEHLCPPGTRHTGELTVSRWPARPLPLGLPIIPITAATTTIELRPDRFTYDAPAAAAVEWHLNFAHSSLFIAYGGPLFAQDEMQVAEHPVLACVREHLASQPDLRLSPLTRENGVTTPVLIRGAQRRGAVATDPDPDQGRPHGLYGAAFARAPIDVVLRAARRIDPPTTSNILAMEAPAGGYGRYTLDQLVDIAVTAYTGFAAARSESHHAAGSQAAVIVHTGHWGTGAYGGDRVLMAMLQFLAARAAGLDRLVFHTFDHSGARPCHDALARLDAMGDISLEAALTRIDAAGFQWGMSDGN
jgi:hypothetical protein